jgi:uncharacterized HhH-GPD family protein
LPLQIRIAPYETCKIRVFVGAAKAQIFVALLGKQLGVRPSGWREAAGSFGGEGAYVSVADIVDDESLGRVRSYKQTLKAAAKAKTAK